MTEASTSTKRGEIDSGKVVIKKIFTDFWFKIPEYQRSYVWGEDQISELLDDITYASENYPENEYFLGSMVLQKRYHNEPHNGNTIKFEEFDVLDGQQRLTTIFLMLAVIRDITESTKLKTNCANYIFQEEDPYENTPERLRLVYKIREDVEDFIHQYVKNENGTTKSDDLFKFAQNHNISITNMSSALLQMRNHFLSLPQEQLNHFVKFLINNVLMIYVSSENLEDAFRLFTILNDRGIPLRNSDILKSTNLGVLVKESDKQKYAQFWEETEGQFGQDEFDRFLNHIRAIYVKDKARDNLVKEFEEKIYKVNPPLLSRGKDTLETIREYKEYYQKLIWFEGLPDSISNSFKNLISVMNTGLPSTDWIPALLIYYKKFKEHRLLEFLRKLDNKFSADWIVQLTPTFRMKNMYDIIKKIEASNSSDSLLQDPDIFSIEFDEIRRMFHGEIYKRRYVKYILLKLEYLNIDQSMVFHKFDYISVEHILPQNPDQNSQWKQTFTKEQHEQWVHKLGNLVLLSRRKNSQLNNRDFLDKKKRYFGSNISSFPCSLKVMQLDEWNPLEVKKRHNESVDLLINYYKNS